LRRLQTGLLVRIESSALMAIPLEFVEARKRQSGPVCVLTADLSSKKGLIASRLRRASLCGAPATAECGWLISSALSADHRAAHVGTAYRADQLVVLDHRQAPDLLGRHRRRRLVHLVLRRQHDGVFDPLALDRLVAARGTLLPRQVGQRADGASLAPALRERRGGRPGRSSGRPAVAQAGARGRAGAYARAVSAALPGLHDQAPPREAREAARPQARLHHHRLYLQSGMVRPAINSCAIYYGQKNAPATGTSRAALRGRDSGLRAAPLRSIALASGIQGLPEPKLAG